MTAERIRMQLGVLNELLSVASATKDVNEILDQSLSIILNTLRQTVGGVYLGDDNEGLQLATHNGLSAEHLTKVQNVRLDGDLWRLGAHGAEVMTLHPTNAEATPLEAVLADMGLQWALVFPLLAHDESLGYLFVSSMQEITLSQVDREFLDTVGRAVGLAVEHSRLYEQMEHRLLESQALYKVSRALTSTLDLDHLLNLIVRSAVDTVTKAHNGVLHLLDEDTGELHPRALSFIGNSRPNPAGRSRMRIGQGAAGYALEMGQVVNIPDVSRDARFLRVGEVRPFASMIVAPLKLGDRRIGTLSMDSDEVRAFSPDDERLLMTLATQAAAAIENARLVRDLQQSLRDLQAAQAQLIQSEKLSAIGQLIAGVAHELNNPLTAIMGYAQLLQTTEGVGEDVLRDLSKIYMQAQRAARIVQNLLTFARQHKAERQLININEALERTLELRSYQLRVENIEVVTQLAENVPGTIADPNQMQQVFLNLINNAQDAMTEYRGGGHLVVTTEFHDGKIKIKFRDNGPGLSPQALKHLFEPFFTTKEVGKGTGLGLSICFGIVSQHGGHIWAESEPGQGATFIVELPVIQAEPARAGEKKEDQSPRAQGKLVLVVEDEEDVAMLLQRILSQDGHRVLLAQDGHVALDHLIEARKQGTNFNLIISDIKMPGVNGPALYERVRQEMPDLAKCMVFITGDTMSPSTEAFLQRANLPYLAKPFTVNELRRAMASILEQPNA